MECITGIERVPIALVMLRYADSKSFSDGLILKSQFISLNAGEGGFRNRISFLNRLINSSSFLLSGLTSKYS
jgi:hypothetical protein